MSSKAETREEAKNTEGPNDPMFPARGSVPLPRPGDRSSLAVLQITAIDKRNNIKFPFKRNT